MTDERLLTKNNHYYPRCLIKNWANGDGKVRKILINSGTQLISSVAENLFSKRIYDNATEDNTSKDDSALASFIKRLKNDTNRELILQDVNFLQLIFKLFARQPKLNEGSYNSVKNAILNEPYIALGIKRDENIFDSKAYKRMIHHALLATSEYDISESWMNAKYIFGFNKTQKPFILPDNTKALILPLTPTICVGIIDLTQTNASVGIEEITDISKIESINKILMGNCDSYYISKDWIY